MRELTNQQQRLIEENMYIVQIAYKKILWFGNLEAYKDEIISEGYLGICVASTLYNPEIDDNPFPYFFKSALMRMISFIKKFIFTYMEDISIDDNPELIDAMTYESATSLASSNIFDFIDDLIISYKYYVLNNPDLSDIKKHRKTSDEYLTKLRFILFCLYLGYSQPEIGRMLKVTKSCINLHIKELRSILPKCELVE